MNQLKTFKKQKKGITLIALVITIIVLLILAAVSIATLTGQNGILTKAQESKEKSETAQKDEEAKLAQAEANMNFGDTKYNDVTIPTGMTPTRKEGESTVDEGLVAIDQNGNEWVWIEVPKSAMPQETITFVNPTGYSDEDETQCTKIETSLRTYAKKYAGGTYEQGYVWKDKWYAVDENDIVITESTATDDKQRQLSNGCGLTLKEYKEKYQKMLKSVYTNGGFWIGRYEAGIKGTRGTGQESFELARKYGDDISTTQIVIQKDAIVCNYVTCSQAQILSSNLSPDSTKTTSLMFGIQWDLVCMFLESKNALTQDDINKDSGSWGNYSDNDLKITSEKAKGHFYKASNDARWDIISLEAL